MRKSRHTTASRELAEECLALRLRRLSRRLTRAYDEALRDHGVTANQLNVLAVIDRLPGARQTDLVRRLEMDKSTVSRTVDRMLRNGWLAESSGAVGSFELSRGGREVLQDALPAWRSAQQRAEELLGKRIVSALRAIK